MRQMPKSPPKKSRHIPQLPVLSRKNQATNERLVEVLESVERLANTLAPIRRETFWVRVANKLDNLSLLRVLSHLGHIAILLAVAALVVDIFGQMEARRALELERKEWKNARIAAAWSTLTTPASGNTGKGAALEYLLKNGQSFEGIDISCPTNNGDWDSETLSCLRPVVLTGLNLKKIPGSPESYTEQFGRGIPGIDFRSADLRGAAFSRSNLTGAILFGTEAAGAKFNSANLEYSTMFAADARHAGFDHSNFHRAQIIMMDFDHSDFTDAKLTKALANGSDFSHTSLWNADFSGASLTEVNFQDATALGTKFIDADLFKANFKDTDLSGADFKDAKNMTPTQLNNAWAHVDFPPINLPSQVAGPRLCELLADNRQPEPPSSGLFKRAVRKGSGADFYKRRPANCQISKTTEPQDEKD